jgi:hypothetical protein
MIARIGSDFIGDLSSPGAAILGDLGALVVLLPWRCARHHHPERVTMVLFRHAH